MMTCLFTFVPQGVLERCNSENYTLVVKLNLLSEPCNLLSVLKFLSIF